MKTVVTAASFLALLACMPSQTRSNDAGPQINALKDEVQQLHQQIEVINKNYQRYIIVMRPNIRADIYLLDTATGRVWREFEDTKTHQMFWKESSREDDPDEAARETK